MNYVYLGIALCFLAWTGLSIYYLQAELREDKPDVASSIVYSVMTLAGLLISIYCLVLTFRTGGKKTTKKKASFRM